MKYLPAILFGIITSLLERFRECTFMDNRLHLLLDKLHIDPVSPWGIWITSNKADQLTSKWLYFFRDGYHGAKFAIYGLFFLAMFHIWQVGKRNKSIFWLIVVMIVSFGITQTIFDWWLF